MSTYPDLIVQFDKYAQLIRGDEGNRNLAREDLVSEVDERLHQLAFIIQQLNDIDAQFGQLVIATVTNQNGENEYQNPLFERDEHLRFVMRLLTESFYYFAFRIRQIIRNEIHKFPKISSFDCVGVRDVRNQLIEHPEGKDSRIFNRTFMWSKETGMQLKTGRQEWESNKFEDAGMKANANEFCEKLNQLLERAINEILSEKTPKPPTCHTP